MNKQITYKQLKKWFEDNVYTSPHGSEFLFWQDVQKFLGKSEYKKFDKFMRGSTVSMLPNGDGGIYPVDLEYFLKGYKQNHD